MKKLFILGITLLMLVFVLSSNVSAEGQLGVVIDTGGYLTAEENRTVTLKAQQAAEKTEMNIVIYVCDDVGYDKSDNGVVNRADVMYENLCGKNTDGILLLINLDTKYDYISTSGVAINYFSDYRIERMFDMFWDDLVDEKYADAACGFIDSVLYYFDLVKAYNRTESTGKWVIPEDFFKLLLGSMIFAIVVGIIIFSANRKKYKLQKASTREYIVEGSLMLSQRTDTFIKTIVNRVYSPRNTGSSGGGSYSSNHRSSGGGGSQSSTYRSGGGGGSQSSTYRSGGGGGSQSSAYRSGGGGVSRSSTYRSSGGGSFRSSTHRSSGGGSHGGGGRHR